MKKNIFFALALATTMVACTDDYTDWAAPQHNDPETPQSVSFSAAAVSAIDFATLTDDSVAVFTPTITMEKDATVSYKVTLEGTQILEANKAGKVSTEKLNAAIVALYGKRPTERTMQAVVDAYVNINGLVIKSTADAIEVKATLVAPVIENAYYLIGTPNNWTIGDTSLKFNHSGEDVYDDPVFTLTVEAPYTDEQKTERTDLWFKIVPESALTKTGDDFWAVVLGSDEKNGDSRTEAGLALKGEEDNSFTQPATDGAKFYTISLNMMDGKMTIKPLAFEEFIYAPGNHQNWTPATAPALQSAGFDGVYKGFSPLDGGFKFTKARDWNQGEYNSSDFSTVSEGLVLGEGGGNIEMTAKDFYYIVADVVKGDLTATATTWGLIGSATSGQWDTDTPMVYNANDQSWSVTTDLTTGEFKFRANNDWIIDVGGTADDLTFGGSNITLTEAGNYTITLFLTRSTSNKMYCTIIKN